MTASEFIGRVLKSPRARLRDLTLVTALCLYDFDLPSIVAGVAVFSLGASLHFWSKGVLVRNWMLTTAGPYRFVRHPFYLGNLLIDLGICLLAGELILLLLYLPFYAFVYGRTIRSEEHFLRDTYPDEYEAYAQRTPALLSVKLYRLIGPLDFSWNIIQQEQEVPRLLRILAIPGLFLIVHSIFDSEADLSVRVLLVVAGAAAALLCNLLSILMRQRNRRDMLFGY